MKWKFKPAAPLFGGVWKRLIKTVKKSLYGVLNEKVAKVETLHTLLVEVEYQVIRNVLLSITFCWDREVLNLCRREDSTPTTMADCAALHRQILASVVQRICTHITCTLKVDEMQRERENRKRR
jgi:hypothetical protein